MGINLCRVGHRGIAIWVVAVLVLYGIIYVDWGADFWHPLR